MIVPGQRYFKIRISFTNHFQRLLHHFHRTFVHCNSTNIKPSFFFQMLGERGKHRSPHFFISRITRCSFHELQRVGCLIVVLEWQFPWNHWVTINLFINAYTHHKFHPTVEDSIIKSPCSICPFHPGDHCIKIIFCLTIPGFMCQSSRDNLLSGICQHFHQRTHSVKMLLAP